MGKLLYSLYICLLCVYFMVILSEKRSLSSQEYDDSMVETIPVLLKLEKDTTK